MTLASFVAKCILQVHYKEQKAHKGQWMWVNGHASLYLKVWHVTLPVTDDFLWRLVNWHLLLCRLIHSPSVRWILITWIMVIHCVYIFYMPLVDYGFWFNLIYFVLYIFGAICWIESHELWSEKNIWSGSYYLKCS